MSICKNCIHADLCDRPILQMNAELDNKCGYYKDEHNYYDLPAYVGMQVWVPFFWFDGRTDIEEGKVSGLQQKVDGSWKIRVSRRGCVADFTIKDFNTHCFKSKEDAEKFVEEKLNERIQIEKELAEHGL